MPNYQNGKIYRLTSKNGLVYYGSTVKKLSDRYDHHKSGHKCYTQGSTSKYCCSFKLFDEGEVEIDLVLEVPCNCKEELEEVERTYIENDICVNKKIPALSRDEVAANIRKCNLEYKAKNKESIAKKAKEYNLKNIDKIREYKNFRKFEKKYFTKLLKDELRP